MLSSLLFLVCTCMRLRSPRRSGLRGRSGERAGVPKRRGTPSQRWAPLPLRRFLHGVNIRPRTSSPVLSLSYRSGGYLRFCHLAEFPLDDEITEIRGLDLCEPETKGPIVRPAAQRRSVSSKQLVIVVIKNGYLKH